MDDYGQDQEQQEIDDRMAAEAHQQELECRRVEEDFDWQDELDNDPGYHAWLDDLEAEENERRFNVLTVWDF